ncbi:hypothetical protein [Azospirillum sp. B506]|uniref:hypothetical protein n=1 Tax=Azospirillum sp. B506 TaxID=137721 RepID=UPI00034D8488|nr:hypothetical protein [Azospirillum sp. B506]
MAQGIGIYQLPEADTLTGDENIPIDSGADTKRVTVAKIREGLLQEDGDASQAVVKGRTLDARADDVVVSLDFGADGSGNAAVAAANRSALQAAVNSMPYGGALRLRRGTYYVSGTVTIPAGVTVEGEGEYASTVITTSATADVFVLGAASGLRNLKISASVTRTAGRHAVIAGNGAVVQGCEFYGYYVGVEVGDPSTMITRPRIINCGFADGVAATGAGAIAGTRWSNLIIEGVTISAGTAVTQPDFGIRLRHGDTAYLSRVNATAHGNALLVEPQAGQSVYAITVSDSHFDSAYMVASGADASACKIVPNGGGVYNTKFCNVWFGLSKGEGCLVETFSGGIVDGLLFTACEWPANYGNGLKISGPGVKNWSAYGGAAAGNGGSGARIINNKGWGILGLATGNYSGRGTNGRYGIEISNCDNYRIAGCDLFDSALGPLNDLSRSATKVLEGNIGIVLEAAGTASVAFNASGIGTIAHGLSAAPIWADVTVLFTSNPERAAVQSMDATNITVRLSATTNNSAVTGGPWLVTWSAKI